VKLDKLVKQIRRDATAHPKKAAALGLMALVALYFWAPLVWKWLAPAEGKRRVKSQNVALILTDDPIEATDKSKTRSVNKFRWEKVRQLIDSDPQMVSATFDAAWIDPFGPRQDSTKETAPDSESTTATSAAADVQIDPTEAGLVLTGVMISPRRRTATINGQLYREDEVVNVSGKNNAATSVDFRVVRIDRQQVELERQGRKFVLELSRPQLGQRDLIERAGQTREN
jgi:hypothetical protein